VVPVKLKDGKVFRIGSGPVAFAGMTAEEARKADTTSVRTDLLSFMILL
jgi:hypothetical protein